MSRRNAGAIALACCCKKKGGHHTPCCPNSFPDVLHANVAGSRLMDGSYTLTFRDAVPDYAGGSLRDDSGPVWGSSPGEWYSDWKPTLYCPRFDFSNNIQFGHFLHFSPLLSCRLFVIQSGWMVNADLPGDPGHWGFFGGLVLGTTFPPREPDPPIGPPNPCRFAHSCDPIYLYGGLRQLNAGFGPFIDCKPGNREPGHTCQFPGSGGNPTAELFA